MRTVQHFVFDIGRVLLNYDPHLGYLDLIPDLEERTAFLETVCNHAWVTEQDRGRSWEDSEAQLIAQFPNEEPLIRAFRQRWITMVPSAIEQNVSLMHDLIEAGKDVTLLTNFAADTFIEAQKKFTFLSAPRGATVSGHCGLLKPAKEIFALHDKTFNLAPQKTIFVDDVMKNVDAARHHGWHAIHYSEDIDLPGAIAPFLL